MNTLPLASPAQARRPSTYRIGLVASALAALFLLADAASQLLAVAPVLAAAVHIGFPATPAVWQGLGALLLVATVLYLVPRTALFGAVLVSGYLGGAICAHVRIGEGLAAPTLVSLVVAVLAWAGLVLRDARLADVVRGR